MTYTTGLSFTTNEVPTITKLNQLAANVRFLAETQGAPGTAGTYRPMWHLYKIANESIPASTVTMFQCALNAAGLDSDGVFSTSTSPLTLQTAGFYECSVNIPFVVTSTSFMQRVFFRIDVGSSNPNHTAGTTFKFGGGSQGSGTDTGINTCVSANGVTPIVCYPGDQIAAYIWTSAAATVTTENINAGASYAQFSGRWIGLPSNGLP